MKTEKNEKRPSLATRDYIMSDLLFTSTYSIHTLCAYMQRTTAYGEAYENAIQTIDKISRQLAKLEKQLLDCTYNRKGEGK